MSETLNRKNDQLESGIVREQSVMCLTERGKSDCEKVVKEMGLDYKFEKRTDSLNELTSIVFQATDDDARKFLRKIIDMQKKEY